MNRTCPIQAYGSTVIRAVNTALTHNFATLQTLQTLWTILGYCLPFALKTVAFPSLQNVGFPSSKPGYPCGPQLYNFRDSITRPTFLIPSARYTPCWICTRGALLSRWPILLRQDLDFFYPHLLGNNNHFLRFLPDPMILGLA